jgi:hypothetical protein
MKKLGVYEYETKELLGVFLNVTENNNEVKVWYHDDWNESIKFKYREDILIKEIVE